MYADVREKGMDTMNRLGELSKSESTQLKGIAILSMVALHLFCRKTDLPYTDVTVWGMPLSYFFGLFGDQCVAIYCFCSGYAHCLLRSAAVDTKTYVCASVRRLLRFLMHFWVVVLVFSGVGLLVHSTDIPQSVPAFLGNIFLYRLSYNGAWWFVLTYCLLTLLSDGLFRLCRRTHPVLLIGVFLALYAAGHFLRYRNPIQIADPVLHALVQQCALLCTSLFPYMLGMAFYSHKWITALRVIVSSRKIPDGLMRTAAVAATAVMILCHAIVESSIVAAFTAMATILLFALTPRTKVTDKALLFFGGHSTNIWLVHMFFYMTLFRDFVFIAHWPILIFLLMLAVCTAVSYALRPLQKGAVKLLHV